MHQEDRFDRQPLNEISLSRIASHVQKRPIALLTAFRFKNKETGEPISLQTNRTNNAKLENDIRAAGFGFQKLIGRYEEDYGDKKVKVTEESFLIIGRDDSPASVGGIKGFAKKMGQKYGQTAFCSRIRRTKKRCLSVRGKVRGLVLMLLRPLVSSTRCVLMAFTRSW